ncbi:MAG: hypothetical protein OEM07_03750 [Gammaproteobacteria bacterium]|nr:hypothetical protein [Gammaproteobacteria bacterium]
MKKLITSLAFSALLLPISSFALGLGEIQLDSGLNEQLDARINLIGAVPEDAEVLIVKLASREDFIKSGIDRPHELTSLKFRTVVEDDQIYINVTSAKPVREPSMNFLVEVDWPKGHLIRQYALLLEPPASMRRKAPQQATDSSRPAVSGM